MTTPGGVPNLPLGALTVETLGQQLQDLSAATVRRRAGERMPQVFHNSTGGNILNDLSPFGILTRIWAEINALIAASSPNDINGPEDLPPLITDFIEGLPVVGQLFDLLLALLGQYDGDDQALNEIQALFAPMRTLVDAFGQLVGDDLTKLAGFLDGFNVYDPVNSSTRLINQILDFVIEEVKRRLGIPDGGDLPDEIPVVSELARQLLGLPKNTNLALDLTAIGGWAKDLLSVNSKNIPASGIRGTLSPGVFDIIPVGALSANQPNMITMSRFEDAADVDASDGWSWDGITNYTGDTGALRFDVTSTGTRDLVSDQNIGVSPEDQLTLSVWVKSSTAPVSPATTPAAYAGTGSPIKIFIVPYSGANPLTPIEITSRGGTSGAWTQLSGTYTIPKVYTNQITSVHFMLRVTTAATAGVVWFDGISLTKTGLIGQALVPAFAQMLSSATVGTVANLGNLARNAALGLDGLAKALLDALAGNASVAPTPASSLSVWTPPSYGTISGNVRNFVNTTVRATQGKPNTPIRLPGGSTVAGGAALVAANPPSFNYSVGDIETSTIALTGSISGLSKTFIKQAQEAANRYNRYYYTEDFTTRPASTSLPFYFTQTYGLISGTSTTGTFTAAAGTGTGYFGVSGGSAQVFNASDSGDNRNSIAINSYVTQTAYQKVGIFCATAPDNIIVDSVNNPAYNYIIARSDSTGANCVYARLGDSICEIWKSVNNTHTRLAAYSGTFKFKAGSAYWLTAGQYSNGAGTKRFVIYENDNPLVVVDDDTVSDTNLYTGFGCSWKTFSYQGYLIASLPSKILAYAAYDNQPGTLGCGAALTRSGTSTVTLSGTNAVFPASFWAASVTAGTIAVPSGGLGLVDIKITGWYAISCRVGLTSSSGTSNSLQLRVSTSTVDIQSDTATAYRGPISPSGSGVVQATWIAYLQKGHYVMPAYTISSGTTVNTSDATFFNVSFLHNVNPSDDSQSIRRNANQVDTNDYSNGFSYAGEWTA